MMRLLLICSSLLLVCAAAILSRDTPRTTVSGLIEIVQRSKTHESLSDIVVWLVPQQGNSGETIRAPHAELLQKNKMFHPHVLAVSVGTVVDFPNADPIFHNAFSNFDGQLFDLTLYPPGTSKSIRFRRPGIVRVFCNIHPSMSAVIVVLDTPYFTKANADGQYEIPNVPPGAYELHVFDELATAGPDVNKTVTADASHSVTTAPVIHLSELGYVRQPHKNKYGLDYPASATDTQTYSGPPQ